MEKQIKIWPQCHPYWFDDDGTKIDGKYSKLLVYSNTYDGGHLLPCCECNVPEPTNKDFAAFGLHDDELKVSKHSDITNIIISKQWMNFHRTLLEEPEKAPAICKKVCGIKHPVYLPENYDEEDEV
jgi:hypothetical protein